MNVRKTAAAGLAAALVVGLTGVGTAVADDVATTTITGKVTSGGTPVANASVRVFTPGSPESTRYTTTDETGTYVLDYGLTGGSYVVAAENWIWEGSDFQTADFLTTYSGNTVREPDAKAVTVAEGGSATANIAVVPGATVKGKIVDSKGKPVKGAWVSAYNTTRHGSDYADATDANGNYVLKGLATGKVEISSSVWNTKSTSSGTVTVAAKQGATVTAKTLRMDKVTFGTITGKVKGLKKGDTVWVYDTKLKYSYQVGAAEKKGSLKVKENLAPGTYRLVVGGTNVASKAVTVKAKKTSKAGSLKAPKKRTKVTGKIKGSNGKALKTAWVSLVDSYGTYLPGAGTNKKGKYTIKGVYSGAYTVSASDSTGKNAWTSAKITVTKGKNAKKNLKLGKTYKVTGTVKHAGKAVEGANVSASGAWATTGADGKFVLTGVVGGKQTFSVYDPYTGGYLNVNAKVTVKKNMTWNPTVK